MTAAVENEDIKPWSAQAHMSPSCVGRKMGELGSEQEQVDKDKESLAANLNDQTLALSNAEKSFITKS